MYADAMNPSTGNIPSGRRRLDAGRELHLSASHCLPARYPEQACDLCVEACPVDAIGSVAGIPALTGTCIGCGQCAAACPSGALDLAGFQLPAIADDVGDEIFVDCWRVPFEMSPAGALRVPCLAGLGTGWLAGLVERAGERPVHLLDRGACDACPAGKGVSGLRARVSEARILLFESGVAPESLPSITFVPTETALTPGIPESSQEMRMGRRSFFRNLAGQMARGAEQVAATGIDADDPIVLRQEVEPIDRLRLVTALATIARRHQRDLPNKVLPHLSLGDCSGHGICAGVCPTGALTRAIVGDTVGDAAELKFLAARCIACGQCARSCPDKALRVATTGGSAAVEVLARWPERRCTECGESFFGTSGDVCPACSKTQQLFHGMAALSQPRV